MRSQAPTVSVTGRRLTVDLTPDDLAALQRAATLRNTTPDDLFARAVNALLHKKQRDPATFRTVAVAGKFTETETQMLKAQARRRGVSLAEWARDILIHAADPEHKALVFEADALRQLLLGIIVHLSTNGRELSIAQLKKLQDEADERASRRAMAAISTQQLPGVAGSVPHSPEAYHNA